MNDIEELVDPEQFVETGYKLVCCSATKEYGYRKRSLTVSPCSNLIIESRDDEDYFVYRRYSTNDITDIIAFKDDDRHLPKLASLWASFFDQELLMMIEEDSGPLTRILESFSSEVSDGVGIDGSESPASKRVCL